MCLYNTDELSICNVPVKDCVKYLGIHITKNIAQRQKLNFLPKIQKTKSILNMWLQRDLSIYGRVLLMKAEGISRFVYPALSLSVDGLYCKEINNAFVKFIWKNRHHYLKKEVMQAKRADGGLELINFIDLNHTFKIKWLKQCLNNYTSVWNFIAFNIFKKNGRIGFFNEMQL